MLLNIWPVWIQIRQIGTTYSFSFTFSCAVDTFMHLDTYANVVWLIATLSFLMWKWNFLFFGRRAKAKGAIRQCNLGLSTQYSLTSQVVWDIWRHWQYDSGAAKTKIVHFCSGFVHVIWHGDPWAYTNYFWIWIPVSSLPWSPCLQHFQNGRHEYSLGCYNAYCSLGARSLLLLYQKVWKIFLMWN